MKKLQGGPIDILLVEDNPGDVRLAQEALRETNVPNTLRVVEDGQQAVALLKSDDESPPDLIILDLNLPRKDGRQVLQEIKSDPNLLHIPVVILTTSKAEQDVRKAYELHANCFITKASDWDRSCEVVKSIHEFWSQTVTLSPKKKESGKV
jgi:CheY-like chemotaxis protein